MLDDFFFVVAPLCKWNGRIPPKTLFLNYERHLDFPPKKLEAAMKLQV